ncbi:MAG TPA: MFS transporter [Pseudonocardiaceae bacterium]|nr:MFS transporter [Pseudonocardiaceae bacterium]
MPVPRSPTRRVGLLREHDFRHLWVADVVSQFGTRVSFLALPLLAVSYLHASTVEVSLLRTAQTIAYLLIGLQVGAWCDRMRRGPVVVAADLGRAALLCWVPVGAALGVLTVWQLYIVVGLAGALGVFFDVARHAYLPDLISRDNLVEGNTKLAVNQSSAAIAAPAIGGLLVQGLGAPIAIAVDAASYLWSGLWLRGIRTVERPRPRPAGRHLLREIGEGLRVVWHEPVLRAFGAHNASLSLCQSANTAIAVVFLVREVHLSPGIIGLLGTVGLLGAIIASATTRRLSGLIGPARMIWLVGGIVCGAGMFIYPLTAPGWRIWLDAASTFLASTGIIVLNIVESSFQQAVCPPDLLGRVNATMSFLVWGVIPVGSLAGGLAGAAIGLRPTLWLAGAGALASAGWLVFSPLRGMRDLPTTLAGRGDSQASTGH